MTAGIQAVHRARAVVLREDHGTMSSFSKVSFPLLSRPSTHVLVVSTSTKQQTSTCHLQVLSHQIKRLSRNHPHNAPSWFSISRALIFPGYVNMYSVNCLVFFFPYYQFNLDLTLYSKRSTIIVLFR